MAHLHTQEYCATGVFALLLQPAFPVSSGQVTDSNALEALFPGPRRVVLSAIFSEPDRWWTVPELAGRAGVQPASLRQHIVMLREGGMIREKQDEDGPNAYRADPECPIFDELRSIVAKLAPKSRSSQTILVVEDQPATAQITRILLESWGYRVLEARGGVEALGIYDQCDGAIDLLLTDVIMPGMNGPQLAEELLNRNPELRIVYMSGYPSDELKDRANAFLPKPFNPASLSKMIRKELDRPAVRRINHS